MIRNDREFRTAKAHAEQFRRTLADPSRPPPGVQSGTYRASMGALQRHLDALDTDIDSYQALKSGAERGRLRGRLEDLGNLLVHARTARGWTHRQLADELGVRVEEVAEYRGECLCDGHPDSPT